MRTPLPMNNLRSLIHICKTSTRSLLLILALSIVYPLTGCNSSEGKLDESGKAMNVTFDLLSGYDYEKEQIPELVKSLDGQRVAITGFMLPVDFEQGKVTSFILLNNQMGCCFGIMPRMNEFIYVKMKPNTSTKFMTDIPITVLGKFEIGQDNLIGSLYGIEAEKVEISKGL